MNILAFDTAMENCSIAIKTSLGEVFHSNIPQSRGHAEILVPKIEELMEEAELSFHDLNLLTTTIGPGSFTGLRIGLSTAEGYSLSTGLPLIGISTLEMLAQGVGKSDKRVVSIIDSKRGDYYYQMFDQNIIPLTFPDIISPENISKTILEKDMILVGTGAESAFKYFKNKNVEIYKETIDARVLLDSAKIKYESGEIKGHPNDCKPLYLRAADAKAPKESDIIILDD